MEAVDKQSDQVLSHSKAHSLFGPGLLFILGVLLCLLADEMDLRLVYPIYWSGILLQGATLLWAFFKARSTGSRDARKLCQYVMIMLSLSLVGFYFIRQELQSMPESARHDRPHLHQMSSYSEQALEHNAAGD